MEIQEGREDQGNLVQEIGKSVEVQEIQGSSGGPGRSVKSREVQEAFGGQVNFEMELLSGVVKADPVVSLGICMELTQMRFVHFQYQVHQVSPHFSDLHLKFFPPLL
jgi:hypothetical protein